MRILEAFATNASIASEIRINPENLWLWPCFAWKAGFWKSALNGTIVDCIAADSIYCIGPRYSGFFAFAPVWAFEWRAID
jgi:hypothetical protein